MSVDSGITPDGVPVITRRPPLTGRQRVWIIVIVLAIAVFAVAMTGLIGGKHKRSEATGAHNVSAGIPFSTTPEIKPIERPVPHAIVAPSLAKTPAALTPSSKDAAMDAAIFSTSGQHNDGRARGGGGGGGGQNQEKDDEFSSAMMASGVGGKAKAHRMKHPEFTIPAGIVIPCTLQTAINSELMGFVDCITAAEVRSADGSATMLDKGTQVMGQIKSGLRRGQDRLFILWVRARTPQNVTVDLASPAADELGRAGVTGAVNNHFWKMFWSAALFSLIEYGPQIATSALQNLNHGSNSVTTNTNFISPQQQLANTILQDDLRIPPTLEKNQGDIVSIFVARDLDFSGVYDFRLSNSQVSTCETCQVPTWVTEKDLRANGR